MADVSEQKRELRVQAAEKRRAAHGADVAGAAPEAVRDHFLAAIALRRNAVIGGYWPIANEMDVRPLLQALHGRGHMCALPEVHRGQALTFRRWRPDDTLQPGIFGISVPERRAAVVVPDLLLVPLLAFDYRGGRIGYGAGYYDRTIPAIRNAKPLICVGIAYAAQEVPRVPQDSFDQRLDWVVTENGAQRSERRRFPWLRKFLGS